MLHISFSSSVPEKMKSTLIICDKPSSRVGSWYLCMNEYIAAKGRTFLSSYPCQFWGSWWGGTFALPPNARTRLLCRASCAEAVKWIQRMSRLKDFARSIQTFRVDFSALVLSTVSLHQMTVEPTTMGALC